MGFRFQKRIKLLPGLSVNLSKSGVSSSFGATGARVTLGHGQKRTTLGLPGSGISHSTVKRLAANQPDRRVDGDAFWGWVVVGVFFVCVVAVWLA